MDTDGDGETDVYGFGMRGAKGGQEPWGSFIYGEGGDFENLTSKESVKGMQDFIDLYENGYVPPTAVSDGFKRQLQTSSQVLLQCLSIILALLQIWKRCLEMM